MAPTLDSSGILGNNAISFNETQTQNLKINDGVGVNFNTGEFTVIQVRDIPSFNALRTVLSAPGLVLRAGVSCKIWGYPGTGIIVRYNSTSSHVSLCRSRNKG